MRQSLMSMRWKMSHCLSVYNLQTRSISSKKSGSSAKNHYDSLGISAKATQADIKSAYYKLSMVHHPDKNKASNTASAEKFRDITAAYEILGNVKSRKLYDRGLLLDRSPSNSYVYEEPVNKFYKSRDTRSRPPTMYRETVYNFDQWTKAHYGATFAKRQSQKAKHEMEERWRQEEKAGKDEYKILAVAFGLTLLLYFITQQIDRGKDGAGYDNAKQTKATR